MKLAVIGAGAAGTSAAWKARRAGADVTVFHQRPGSSALTSGALDLSPWERGVFGALHADVLAFATALGMWSIGPAPVRVVTDAGVVRPARGRDNALLDLSDLAGRVIAVPDAPVAGWDGPWLCRALAASDWARDNGATFVSVPVSLLSSATEGKIGAFDFAALHDDPLRAAFLVERLQATRAQCDAWLVGPWLGTVAGTADIIRERLALPCGETTSAPGGPAGGRFEAARDELLSSSGVHVARTRVERLARSKDGWCLTLDALGEGSRSVEFDRVVLALGGVAAGGVLLEGPSLAPPFGSRFRLSVEADVSISADGTTLDRASSLHGVDVHGRGLGVLERVGVATEDVSVVGSIGLFAAGDVIADRPRTMLEAVRSGLAAGRAATSDV